SGRGRVTSWSGDWSSDVCSSDLFEPDRASVVHIGVDHKFAQPLPETTLPRGAGRLPDGAEAILCIGTDFRHKNRIFALRLLEQQIGRASCREMVMAHDVLAATRR